MDVPDLAKDVFAILHRRAHRVRPKAAPQRADERTRHPGDGIDFLTRQRDTLALLPGVGVEHGKRCKFDVPARVAAAADADGQQAGQAGKTARPPAHVRFTDGRTGLRGAREEASGSRVADDPPLAPGCGVMGTMETLGHRPQLVDREDQPVPGAVSLPPAIGLEPAERRCVEHAITDGHAVDVPRVAKAWKPDPTGNRPHCVEQRERVDGRAGDDQPAAVPNDSLRIDHPVEPAIRYDARVVVQEKFSTRADPGRGTEGPIEHAVVHGDPE